MTVLSVNYAARALRLRLPKVCVSIIGEEAEEIVDKAEEVIRENSFIEFRLDYLKNPAAALPRIKRLMDSKPHAIAIATCRRTVAGGKFKGSVAAQVELLTKAAQSGCQLVDLELESAEAMKPAEYEAFRSATSVLILSYHDYKATKKLEEAFQRMEKFPADFYKLVTTATNLHDNVVMMQFLQKTSDHHFMIGHCMGEQGIISRVLGVRAGSVFTFGAANRGEETGPGQVTMRELRDVYRIEQVDTVTRVYGVAGDPVTHSLSPQMLNTAFRRENVNAVFLRLHAKKVEDLVSCAKEIPIHGLSVTMPYKQSVVEFLDNSDVLTQQTGACNTVIRGSDGRFFGFNTDVAGILAPLEEQISLNGIKALVLGAGGAARAAVFGLKQRGADISILNRTPQSAQALAKQAGAKVIKRTDLAKIEFDVIINATSVGMGNNKVSPLEEKELNTKIIFDLVYNPYETKLLQMARAKNLIAISGVEMFVHQGARQFEIWTGKPAPIDEMRQEVFRQLGEKPIPPTPAAAQRALALAEREAQLKAQAEAEEHAERNPEIIEEKKPSVKPVKKVSAKPAVKQVAKPPVEAVLAKPVTKPITKPEAKPAAKPAVKAAPAPTKVAARVAPKAPPTNSKKAAVKVVKKATPVKPVKHPAKAAKKTSKR